MGKFDYDKAEADLYDSGCRHSEEIYGYKEGRSRDGFLREHGLDPKKYESGGSGSSSGDEGCFLTTACIKAKGLPDDCAELNAMRRYRDTYVRGRAGGNDDIAVYYDKAPGIVAAINRLPDADSVWKELYDSLVVNCLRLIENGSNEEAYELYKTYTLELYSKYA